MAFCTAAFVLLIALFGPVKSKVYDRCELAIELRDIYEFPANQLATWICIANYESHFNTSAHNPGSGDHGLFQISELFWCSPGMDLACAVSCSDLKDDDIEDDVVCAKRIFRQHQRISGNGFTAWVVYNLYCNNKDHADKFLNGCFTKEKSKISGTTAALPSSAEKNEIVKKISTTTLNANSKITKPTTKPKTTISSTVKPSSSTAGFSKVTTQHHSLPNKISTTAAPSKTPKTVTASTKVTTPVHRLKLAASSTSKSTATTKNSQSTVKSPKTTVTTALPTKREEKRENRDFYEKNLIASDRNVNLKPRDTKGNDYPFANNNEHLYAVVNRSDYQFTLTSRGFRFIRT